MDGPALGSNRSSDCERRTTWLSLGFEALIRRLGPEPAPDRAADYDVVIVGSGYGGSIAADRLAGASKNGCRSCLRVCVLERGREHLPGSFPTRFADMGGHVRFNTPAMSGAKGKLEGVFDFRVGADISVLVANGLGGGSLINAGVMAFPHHDVFDGSRWPRALRGGGADLEQRAHAIRLELGATHAVEVDTFSGDLDRRKAMATLEAKGVPITVALIDDHITSGKVKLKKCIACGDCATGCNHSAKDSLDVNLLRRASARGVEVYTGATVSRIFKHAVGWRLEIWHTDLTLRGRMAAPVSLLAERVVLAAGTLGSTEILLRSQSDELKFSPVLGRYFSGNGDVLAAIFDGTQPFRGVADEDEAPGRRCVGPTITSMVDLRGAGGKGCVVQDLGVPGSLRRLFEEATATSALFRLLATRDDSGHDPQDQRGDPCAVDPEKSTRSTALAILGHDDALGVMRLLPDDTAFPQDSGVAIDWKAARNDPRIADYHAMAARAIADSDAAGSSLLPNPMWQLLPDDMASMLGARRGPLFTVHPLGGGVMGDDRHGGVVNDRGEVFEAEVDTAPDAVHHGLVVLDGSMVPSSLGINPALTIATLADRAIEQLMSRVWGLTKDAAPIEPGVVRRPIFRQIRDPAPPRETEVQVLERLCGWVDFVDIGARWVELSLLYKPVPLHPRHNDNGKRVVPRMTGHVLPVADDPVLSRVRICRTAGSKYAGSRPGEWDRSNEDADVLFVAPLLEGEVDRKLDPPKKTSGSTLTFFQREASAMWQRRCRAWRAFVLNRGLRDAYQAFADRLSGRAAGEMSILGRIRESFVLATRAGEVRLFDYELTTGPANQREGKEPEVKFASLSTGFAIRGFKRLTYSRRSSPWTQLMRLDLTEFGGLRLGRRRRLEVAPAYFAKLGTPLARLVGQQDQPSALVDLAAFVLYLMRVLISIHLWSFRKPDRPSDRAPQRLPGSVAGLPEPVVHEFAPGDRNPGLVRLTRYPLNSEQRTKQRTPVLLIHGYSASGTTFAHQAVNPNLAGYLWHRGAEPWIVDLRTSCGMPTSTHPWKFEDIAQADIPAAVDFVCRATGCQKIDVVSHCMGSAMFAMAVLDKGAVGDRVATCTRRWVMSQIGPAMYFSPANILRAYLLRYVIHLLPGLNYSLRPGESAPGVDGDMFDRFLAALPYIDDEGGSEFDIENPPTFKFWKRTPWVGTRHRLDALIGRTFDARRMSAEALEHIDDFFGPVSMATLTQTIHFARQGFVTDASGGSWGRKSSLMNERFGSIKTLSLHAIDNGLADVETNRRIAEQTTLSTFGHVARRIARHGHQDCLIGEDVERVFARIDRFLSEG